MNVFPFRLPKVTDSDVEVLRKVTGSPLGYILSGDIPTIHCPLGQVQIGSVLSYQVINYLTKFTL